MLTALRLGFRSFGTLRSQSYIVRASTPRLLVPPCAIRGISSGKGAENDTGSVALSQEQPISLEWTDPRDIVVAVNGEPTFSSLGLGGWSPSGMVQSCFEYLHISHHIPWWGTIVIGTVCVRLLLLPVVISSQRNMAQLANVMPQITHLQSKFTKARLSGNIVETQRYAQELNDFMREKKVNPLKNFLGPLCQMPFFISIFFALRGMANYPVESMKTGGILWFEDLTVADQLYGLPVIACVTLFLTVEVGMDTGQQMGNTSAKTLKNIFRVMPMIMLPFISQFPTALLCYWVSTNMITLIQASVLKIPAVKELCNIPRIVPTPQLQSVQSPVQKDFATSMKESWNNIKLSKKLEEREQWNKIISQNKQDKNKMSSVYAKKSK